MSELDQQYKVLVVDDDEILNSLFCSFLESRGLETLSANSVAAAKHALMHDAELDLVLLDYQLGDGVGLDLLTDELKAQYQSVPPVIMISANEDPEFLEICFAQGIDDYIIKPVNLSLLALKVKALINSIRLQRLVSSQNEELEKFKIEAQREETIAKFTYEYLVARNSQTFQGINQHLQSHSSFSGDIAISRISPSGEIYFLLADATGHGLSAAITIMPLVTVFNSMVAKGFHLQQIVTEVNRKLVNDTPEDRFVAAIAVELNFTKAEMAIWNGGMPPAYWVEDGKIVHKFPSRHMSLGILDESMFDADIVVMEMPDQGTLIMYSDGLIEQPNLKGEQFGYKRLEQALGTTSADPLANILNSLEGHAKGVDYTDDISICTLDPVAIWSDQSRRTLNNIYDIHKSINPFVWEIKVSGQKLANADIPSLANQFLQYVGMDQKTCQKVFAIITEMVVNGLDHGLLGLSSELKHSPEGFMNYFLAREQRLKNLTDRDFIDLRLEWVASEGQKRLIVSCRDSGQGYDFNQDISSNKLQYSGRGLALIRNLTESMEVLAPGNFIKVIL